MLDDLGDEGFVLLLGILLIQNAVVLVPQSGATKPMLAGLTAIAVAHVVAEPHVPTKRHVDASAGYGTTVQTLTPCPPCTVARVDVLGVIQRCGIRTIFTLVTVVTLLAVTTVKEMISHHVLTI